jgi:hypothetical protein
MLDIIHFFFEEDQIHSTTEIKHQKSEVRDNMYKLLYGIDYAYKLEKSDTGLTRAELLEDDKNYPSDDSDIKPFSPKKQGVKPFIPPSQPAEDGIQPFGNMLDSPLK